MANYKLLDNVSVNTVGDKVKGDGGGKQLIITGTLGGGSITIDASFDDGATWAPETYNGDVPAVFTTAQSLYILKIAQNSWIRASLSGSSGASGVTVAIAD